MPFGWAAIQGAVTTQVPHAEPEAFRLQTRDLYVAPSDFGFWQAAIRSADQPDDPDYPWLSRAVASHDAFTIELLYGDHDGGQRTITRFGDDPVVEG